MELFEMWRRLEECDSEVTDHLLIPSDFDEEFCGEVDNREVLDLIYGCDRSGLLSSSRGDFTLPSTKI